MEPELDVITNGRERQAPRPRARADDEAGAPVDPTGPPTRPSARLRWAGPVAGVLLLGAVAVFVATRPGGVPEPVAAPTTTRTTTARVPPADDAGALVAPPPDDRPEATVDQASFAEVVRILAADEVRVSMIGLIGSDYRGGSDAVAMQTDVTPGKLSIAVACVGTGTTRVWLQDGGAGSPAGPPTVLDCRRSGKAQLNATISDTFYSVYIEPDHRTVAVFGFVDVAQFGVG